MADRRRQWCTMGGGVFRINYARFQLLSDRNSTLAEALVSGTSIAAADGGQTTRRGRR